MINLDRGDVERIIEKVLKDLSITVVTGGFTDPNSRTVELKYKDEVLSTAYFDVAGRDEYEG